MDPLLTQAELERVVGSRELAQALDFDGDGYADPDRVADVLSQATAAMRGILGAAWKTDEQIADLVARDPAAKLWLAYLAAGIAGRAKVAFLQPDGAGPYDGLEARGMAGFRALKAGGVRSVAEPEIGSSPVLKPIGITRPSVFGDSGHGRRGPGGF